MKNTFEEIENLNNVNDSLPPSPKTKRQWCKVNCTQKNKLTDKTCAICRRCVCTSCTTTIKIEVICKKCLNINKLVIWHFILAE